MLISWLLLALLLFSLGCEPAPAPPKIVLIAGPKDGAHPTGTHEYEKSVRVLEHCLKQQPGLRVEAHFNGWPRNDETLKDAATVVLISSGSDRRAEDHPLLVGDRLAVLGREMKRGCGLVTLHWSTFFPRDRANATLLEWTGGHFDYESGPAPRRWASDIQTLTTQLTPATPAHPILRGVPTFKLHDELYYRIRLKQDDPRFKPILNAAIPGEKEPQVVAWAIERTGGGRGFAFTGGHFYRNWWVPEFRRTVLNAILWTAHAEVPANGFASALPEEAAFDRQLADLSKDFSPDWTPRPATGKAEPWEKFTDKDWIDDRLRKMDTGPFYNGTFEYSWAGKKHLVPKGTAISLGKNGAGGLIFDRHQLRVAAVWTGRFLQHGDRRFGLMNTPTPAGQPFFATGQCLGWANLDGTWDNSHPHTLPLPPTFGRFKGIKLHGQAVVLTYTIHGRTVQEAFQALDEQTIARVLIVGPGIQEVKLRLPEHEPNPEVDATGGAMVYLLRSAEHSCGLLIPDDKGMIFADEQGVAGLRILPASAERRVTLLYRRGAWPNGAAVRAQVAKLSVDFAKLSEPGPRRWHGPLVTSGFRAADSSAYVIDTLTVPYENPFQALLFLGGLDFLPDGRIACCTAHGDVWLVRFDEDLKKVEWQRFATGLYQPLGLKVVDGKVIVIERGQLTRLHDLNNDGEADWYENLADQWHTAGGEHSYDACLETDPEGNFYFHKGGDLQTPTGGCLLKVSPDGKKVDIFCTGFRHPVGLGCGPTGILTGSDQEGNWMPATRIDEYRQGGFYGDMRTHHRQVPPKTFDPPLCWLPRAVDNSAGGQVWIPPKAFGPLGGHLLHFSYGRCKALLLLRQAAGGQVQGGAYDLNLKFLSGVMRGRFNPKDGCLYVCGMTGWQTGAAADGCLQRVRYTGKPITLPTMLEAKKGRIELTFNAAVDPACIAVKNFDLERWNYRWTGDYGSKHWSVRQPDREGHDEVPITGAVLSADGCTVTLQVPDLAPVMQMKLTWMLRTATGQPLAGEIHLTVNYRTSD